MNCPLDCDAPLSEREKGCPDCEVTILFNGFKSQCLQVLADDEAERARRFELEGRTRSHWQFDELLADLNRVAATEALVGEEGVAPYWTVTTYRLVQILRSERAKARRIDDWNRDRERDGKAKAREDDYA